MNIINPGSSGGVSNIQLYAYIDHPPAGTPTINKASSNVTSITDGLVGLTVVNCTALPSANYTAVISANEVSSTNYIAAVSTKTTTAIGTVMGYNGSTRYDADFGLIVTGA